MSCHRCDKYAVVNSLVRHLDKDAVVRPPSRQTRYCQLLSDKDAVVKQGRCCQQFGQGHCCQQFRQGRCCPATVSTRTLLSNKDAVVSRCQTRTLLSAVVKQGRCCQPLSDKDAVVSRCQTRTLLSAVVRQGRCCQPLLDKDAVVSRC